MNARRHGITGPHEWPTNICKCGHSLKVHVPEHELRNEEPCTECDCEDFQQTYEEVPGIG